MLAIAIACVIAWASIANADSIKTVRVSSVIEDHLVTQDITDDPDRNTVLVVVGATKGFEDLKPSVNLHDFNTGYVAMKSVSDGVCLLKPIPEGKRAHYLRLKDALTEKGTEKFLSYQKTMYWYKHPKVLEYEEIERQAGKLLAEFCRDYKTYNLVPRNMRKILSGQTENHRAKRLCLVCIFCINQVDGYEEDVVDMNYKED